MELGLSGLASGFDWRSLVDQLVEVERVPQRRLKVEKNQLQEKSDAYDEIISKLNNLKDSADTLKESSFFTKRSADVSDTSLATATAADGALLGSYLFDVTQLATATSIDGQSDIASPLSATDDVSSLVLSDAAFSNQVTEGTFTINNSQITVSTSDTLQDVFDAINTATGGDVTASYSSADDKITLSSSSEIILGSAADTSNFLQLTRLTNNGTGSVTSSSKLGSVKITAPLSSSNLSTAVSDGGSGNGEFTINGVSISFDASSDTMNDVIGRINNADAGVSASYDAVNDKLILRNKTTGDVGIALSDVTGNFLSASGLLDGTMQRGNDLQYSVNSGGTLTSHSNTITDDSSGITGLSVNVLQQGSFNITVNSDNESIKSGIQDFVSAYNETQTLIDTYTASSTDADGKVEAGILTGERDAFTLSSELRSYAYDQVSSLSGTINKLDDLGYTTSGYSNQITLSDEEQLDNAISTNLEDVQEFFSDATSGLATSFSTYLENTAGTDGTLETRQDTLSEQMSSIDDQITSMEKLVQSHKEQLINSFVQMEKAQAKIDQQMQFLNQKFGS
ncbi:MAG: flagellar filament capping protein FliD [Verrucomicrobia bacterium]|nr:flagellar filament capping protein FliD [Verrucomicrobiota bacterium]MCF7708912.1 flagellar filament capping protein FliD [Verrucomicrobiota bacterium]